MIVELKNNHDRNGYIMNQALIDFLKEHPETIITVHIMKAHFPFKEHDRIILSGVLTDVYIAEEDINFDSNNLCYLKIKYDGLGNFGGPYISSISIDIDQEMLFYLKMKGL